MTTLDFYTEIVRIWLEPWRKLGRSPGGCFVLSILKGMVGAILLLGFTSMLVNGQTLKTLLPWFLGFNAAITGFNYLEKTGGRLRNQWFVCGLGGVIMAIPACVLFNLVLGYPAQVQGIMLFGYLIFSGCLGIGGGWIAVRSRELKRIVQGQNNAGQCTNLGSKGSPGTRDRSLNDKRGEKRR